MSLDLGLTVTAVAPAPEVLNSSAQALPQLRLGRVTRNAGGAQALARWESEGGSIAPDRGEDVPR